jgi:hypothetical protein
VILILTVPWTGSLRRPDLPEGASFEVVSADGDQVTVDAWSEDQVGLERWAAAQGYHTPASVRSEQLWIALYQTDPAVFAAVEQMVEVSTPVRLATRAATVRRVSQTVAGLRDALQASGFSYVDDAWLDQLWRAAGQVET